MINLTGGATAWESMDAVPESVTIEFLRTGDGRLVAHHTIQCGPVNHLEPGYLIQLSNLFWNRNRSGIDAYSRLTGTAASSQVDLSAETARENSVPATPDFAIQNTYAPDATNTGYTNVITHDATTGSTSVSQVNSTTGATVTTGLVMPQYNGTGAPAAGTLAANAYYRQYSTYLDMTTPTAPVEWVCTTAGTNSTSAWAQVSGGGGGMNFRGYWVDTTHYALNDVVVIQAGVSAGLYISLIAANANDPATGTGWMQIAPGNMVGSWT
jgi:hypothetical protein